MGGAGDIDPSGARVLAPVDRGAEIVAGAVVEGGLQRVGFRDVTDPEPRSCEQLGICLSAMLDRRDLPASVIAGVVIAGVAWSDPIVLVSEPTLSPGTEPIRALRARCSELSVAGVPAQRIVAEVAVTPGAVDRIIELRGGGLLVGVVVPHTWSPAGSDDPARRGAVVGSLAAAVMAGVASVRTADVATAATARRVRSVLARLTGSSSADVRMVR